MILTFIHGHGIDRGIEWQVDAPIDTYVETSIDRGAARETDIGIGRGFDQSARIRSRPGSRYHHFLLHHLR